MHFKIASVDSLMLYLGEQISPTLLDQVQSAYHQLQGLKGIIEMTPSYNTLWIHYDLSMYNYASIQQAIITRLQHPINTSNQPSGKLIEIPVQYNGLDLQRVATHHHRSIEEIIALHQAPTYRVYAIGFMVGFAYLAQLDPRIATPRLATPRTKVPKGSVAIADRQTAIYPQDSAGGWNIIGHTDFDAFHTFEIGDRVKFIDKN